MRRAVGVGDAQVLAKERRALSSGQSSTEPSSPGPEPTRPARPAEGSVPYARPPAPGSLAPIRGPPDARCRPSGPTVVPQALGAVASSPVARARVPGCRQVHGRHQALSSPVTASPWPPVCLARPAGELVS